MGNDIYDYAASASASAEKFNKQRKAFKYIFSKGEELRDQVSRAGEEERNSRVDGLLASGRVMLAEQREDHEENQAAFKEESEKSVYMNLAVAVSP